MTILGTDDNMELALRRLASYTYEARTGDRAGAASMMATAPPGTGRDIAPSWLVDSATTF